MLTLCVLALRVLNKAQGSGLSKSKIKTGNHQVHVITERCKGCNFCVELCPKHVLYQTTETNSKGYHLIDTSDIDKCTGCGTCSMVCPEFAIFVDSTEEEKQEAELHV